MRKINVSVYLTGSPGLLHLPLVYMHHLQAGFVNGRAKKILYEMIFLRGAAEPSEARVSLGPYVRL